ncbi:glycerate kinase [Cellulophaga sp. HaHa_2_95]|uniref:glycerate kinase n=1 Tax=Cellulophaga sp. HaHa_2_95 TaxID=2745558 RepID=UPI001C4E99FF|nr:glycerate kinase [Cellulophaga sp. HaHa_2_95]QXP54668.1 glycerate kinase [Cellulophaga sp. HaHa_2_95]
MKFVIAPDKFKGSLSGIEFCDAVEEGLLKVFPQADILKIPLADGGDGTVEVIKNYIQGTMVTVKVNNPLFEKVEASYLYSSATKTAYIEMAEASGLKLLAPSEYDCMITSTYGTGELIADCLDRGAEHLILGIGGSATNDAGMGMAAALGYEFFDVNNQSLQPIGSNLIKVHHIAANKVSKKLQKLKVQVACDVTNPLYGKNGAAFIYGAQKGANEDQIKELDLGLQQFSRVLNTMYGTEVQAIVGGGAAGGMGVGVSIFLNGILASGIELIKELADFDAQIKNADWIITGEGKLDAQSLSGKTIQGVLTAAQKEKIKVAALCGVVDLSIAAQEALGITYTTSILKEITTIEEAMDTSVVNLVFAAYNFARCIA